MECCGLLGGHDGIVEQVFPGRNIDCDPRRYHLHPTDQRRMFETLVERQWDLLGIYHSHPHTEALPSLIDIGSCFYSDAVHVIVSLANPEVPEVRAFTIRNGEVREETVQIT
jgi:[CysO sulfur-carrier protein]-S-L-cysteine hydrolase